MRNLLILLVVVGLVGFQPAADPPAAPEVEEDASLNAVDVDPDINTVELENDWVRIVRIKTPPGHTSNRHTHDGGVYVGLTDSKGRSTLDNGDVNESTSRLSGRSACDAGRARQASLDDQGGVRVHADIISRERHHSVPRLPQAVD